MSSVPLRARARELQQDDELAMIDGIPMPLLLLDSSLCVRRVNRAFLEAHGDHKALVARPFPEFAKNGWGLVGLQRPLTAVMAGRRTDYEMEHVTELPERRVFRISARIVSAAMQRLLMVAVEDITFTRFAQERLEEDNGRLQHQFDLVSQALHRTRQDLEHLAGRLLSSQEEERRRLARELHDDLSQQVAILRMDSERMAKEFPKTPQSLGIYLRNLRKQTQKLSRDLRRVAHQLHPSILEHLGLAAALESLVREFGERNGSAAQFQTFGNWSELRLDIGTAVYRIAQEALRNVAKHAGPTPVHVELTSETGRRTLMIRDYGKGFNAEDPRCIGLGLISMQERARLAGGKMEIWSERGAGTRLTVILPAQGQAL